MKPVYSLLSALPLILTVAFFLGVFYVAPSHAEPLTIVRHSDGREISFDVEIADTVQAREKGLMNRTSLAPRQGMLFVYDSPVSPLFWMKNTLIPLDMVYIGADGLIKGIHENAIPQDLTPIPSPQPVLSILEIAGGEAKNLGISAGDRVIRADLKKDAK